MAGYTDMHNDVLKAKAAASNKEEDKKAAEEAEKRTKADEAAKHAPVAAKKQEEQTKVVEEAKPVKEETEEKTFIENSDAAVAKAKVGDWLKRSDGKEVQLTQEDIDAAIAKVNKPKEEPKVEEEPKAEMSEETKDATKDIANNFGVPFGPDVTEEEMTAYGASPDANEAKEALKASVTKGNAPLSEEEFKSIYPSEDPMSQLNWYQQIAPLLTVLSVVTTAIGMANGALIPPINFNKLTGFNEAYQSYLSIMEEDQKQKNADTNTIASPMQAYEEKEKFNKEHGEGAYEEGVETFGAATEAGQMATQEQAHEQEKEKMGIEQKYNLETLDAQQRNELERLDKTGELDLRLKQVDQTFALQNMNEANRLQLAIMAAQAEDNAEMAQLMHDLEANLNADSIKALQDKGLSVNQYARWMKAQGGTTAADTVKDYIDSVSGIASGVTEAAISGATMGLL